MANFTSKQTVKKMALAALAALACAQGAWACTTILVGNKASKDGSYMVARNEDYKANSAKIFIYHKAEAPQKEGFKGGNGFVYPAAKNALQYTSMSDYDVDGKSMGEVGFNSAGVGMSSTETITNGEKALKADPYVKDGIGEDAMQNVILPRVHTAKEGVELLGKIIEEKGAAEGFGVAFVDKDGIWYLETGSGHQWMAAKIPANMYFVSANQGRLVEYIKGDARYLASPTLIDFAVKSGLAKAPIADKKGVAVFDFRAAYTDDTKDDLVYNYPRVWTLQHMYTKGLKTKIDKGSEFPVFLKPAHKLTLADVKKGLRNHFQGSEHDLYAKVNPKEKYRPISVFRTLESHILQVRPKLPSAIGEIEYISYGMTALGVYLPFYAGMSEVPKPLTIGTNKADNKSANWRFRKLQTLVMQDFNAYAPIVQKAYAAFELGLVKQQKTLEKKYLKLYKKDPAAATKLINDFEAKMVDDALALADSLTNEIFTKLTAKVDKTYNAKGA